LKEVNVGDNILIPIPAVDRAKSDFRNMVGVVMDESNGFYTIGTRDGVLSQKYIRNQFLPTESIFLPLSDVPQRQTTLRSSATFESNSTGQGFVHCQCTTRCKTKKCKCRQLFRLCNSRCHNSNCCDNKE
jgi:hypothetical protein